mmetsp:Transcript_94451/g.304999  ORF Transcript_94451/g.304999 Transcript_94451/m.304999 type:complete len:428 (-) Transcript_94451:53-1336(-)
MRGPCCRRRCHGPPPEAPEPAQTAPPEEVVTVTVERDPRSRTTFAAVNESDEPGMLTPVNRSGSLDPERNAGDPAEAAEEAKAEAEAEAAAAKEAAVLEQVQHLVDVEYDIIKAESLLAELEASLAPSNGGWDSVLESPIFARFRRKLDYFTEVGQACCEQGGDWFLAYEDATKTQSIYGQIDPKDSRQCRYRVRVQIPTSLANAVAVANEVQLLPTWNTLVTNAPEVIGRRTAHYMVINYQMTLLGGLLKLDVLNEVRRFSDPQGGFLAEYIESVAEDHPSWRAPPAGFKRTKVLLKNIWVACGQEQTVLLQAGKLSLPFTVSKWLASQVWSVAGRFVMGGFVKNSLQSATPGNPWEELLKADRLGLYRRMGECMESTESAMRKPEENGDNTKVADFDLQHWFHDRRIQRMAPAFDEPGDVRTMAL